MIENFNTIAPFFPFRTKETSIPYLGKLDLQRNLEKLKKSFTEIFSKEIIFTHTYEEEKNVNMSCFMLVECFSLIIEKLNSMAQNDKLAKESIIEKIESISIDKKVNFAINLSNKNLNIFIDYENTDALKELFPDSLEKKLESIL